VNQQYSTGTEELFAMIEEVVTEENLLQLGRLFGNWS